MLGVIPGGCVTIVVTGPITTLFIGERTIAPSVRIRTGTLGCSQFLLNDGVGGDPDDPPASLNWMPSGTSRNYDLAPKPGDMLDWNKDVIRMIEATEYERDAAAIALQFFGGSSSATSLSGTPSTTSTTSR